MTAGRNPGDAWGEIEPQALRWVVVAVVADDNETPDA